MPGMLESASAMASQACKDGANWSINVAVRTPVPTRHTSKASAVRLAAGKRNGRTARASSPRTDWTRAAASICGVVGANLCEFLHVGQIAAADLQGRQGTCVC